MHNDRKGLVVVCGAAAVTVRDKMGRVAEDNEIGRAQRVSTPETCLFVFDGDDDCALTQVKSWSSADSQSFAVWVGNPWGRSSGDVIRDGVEKGAIEALLQTVDGAFAFVVWDARVRRLTAAVDRFAVTPLFYSECNGALWVTDSLSLLAGILDAQVDSTAIVEAVYHQSVTAPRTIYRSLVSVMPGHYVTYDDRHLGVNCYWLFRFRRSVLQPEQALTAVRAALEAACLASAEDTPACQVALSGGIDSSLIAALLARSGKHFLPKTLKVGWEDGTWDESANAAIVARELSVDLETVNVTTELFSGFIRRHCQLMQMPTPLGLGISLLMDTLGKRQRGVWLGGLGADELFYSYTEFNRALFGLDVPSAIERFLRITSPFERESIQSFSDVLSVRFEDVEASLKEQMASTISRCECINSREVVLVLSVYHFLCPCDLPTYRMFATSEGVEFRFPFLRNGVVDAAESIESGVSSYRTERTGKPLLRVLLRDLGFPKSIWGAAKHGFAVPVIHASQAAENWCKESATLPREWELAFTKLTAKHADAGTAIGSYRRWVRAVYMAWLRTAIPTI